MIRLRAEQRVGELLKELARADRSTGGDVKSAPARAEPIRPSPYAATLAVQGISSQAASSYQALVNVPEAEFNAALSVHHGACGAVRKF